MTRSKKPRPEDSQEDDGGDNAEKATDRDSPLSKPKTQEFVTEAQVLAAFEKLKPALHRTVLGRTSGAIKAVERSLPELTTLINEEIGA